MVKRYLVTTADEETWPADKPIVFIGEWCKRYSRRDVWENVDSRTVPYHWDDRRKFGEDYIYLNNLYESSLVELSKYLNSVHQTHFSVRYWRTLIGPWLGIFIQILFDRWYMLKVSLETFDIDSCYVHNKEIEAFAPNDMQSFVDVMVTDSWNELIYAKLLELMPNEINVCRLENKSKISQGESGGVSISNKVKRLIRATFNNLMGLVSCFDDVFILNSCFPMTTDFSIQLGFKEIPKLWSTFVAPETAVSMNSRRWGLKVTNQKSEFSGIVEKMIPLCIPVVYLEGYQELISCQTKLPWPKEPKVIYTSVSYYTDDVFKAWAGAKVENKASLIIGQHGGNFGMTQQAFLESHQIKISDAYLSWGWSDERNKKIIPVGNLVSRRKTKGYDPQGFVLMVEYALPRFSYQLYSVPIASQWLDYFDEQCRFVESLPVMQQDLLRLRLGRSDFGWDQESRWRSLFPNIDFDLGAEPMSKVVTGCRIYIATYNATTFLESLSWNIPTIIFWKPEHWELNNDALEYFYLLEAVGIFHRTPESAARQLMQVWDNVEEWWEKEEVQKARQVFCNQYSFTSGESFEKLQVVFNEFST